MDNIDRFIRILYKDCNLQQLFAVYENKEDFSSCFTLDNPLCKERLLHEYQYHYPHSHNMESLSNLLDFYIHKCKRTDEKVDAIALLSHAVLEMLQVNDETIKVKREHLFHWDGLLNKVDSDMLIGLFIAHNTGKLLANQRETVLRYQGDGDKLYLQSVCDNHMHLKGSGYTTEMSMAAMINTPFSTIEQLQTDIHQLQYHDKFFGESQEEVSENLRKIKFIHLFLWDMQQQAPLFSQDDRRSLLCQDSNILFKDAKERLEHIETHLELHQKAFWAKSNIPSIKSYFMDSRHYFYHAFSHLRVTSDPEYTYLLNMYIAGISKLRFLFAQDNAGTGFARFKYYEDRKGLLVGNIKITDRNIYESVFDKYTEEGCIQYIEFRVIPPNNSQNFYNMVKVLDQLKSSTWKHPIEDYGLVLHFIKEKADAMAPQKNYHRYEKYLAKQQKRLDCVVAMLEEKKNPYTDKIVAIDAANYEIDCPPEVFVQIFERIVAAGEANGRTIYKTFHVGEDFRNIATGIRRVDEAIEWLNLSGSHRLGHASAIGLSVRKYYNTTRHYVSCTAQEWLDDLTWMHHILSQNKPPQFELLCYYLQSLFDQGKTDHCLQPLFDGKEITDYYEVISLRGEWIADTSNRHSLEYKYPLLAQYFHDPAYFAAGQKPYVAKIEESYIACVEAVQKIIFYKILSKNIVIEANPSSNRKIAAIEKNEELPVVQLIDRFAQLAAWENICINTDDSAIFQTNLHNEYAILYHHYGNIYGDIVIKNLMQTANKATFVKSKSLSSPVEKAALPQLCAAIP